MIKFDVILLLAGSGERCGLGFNKVLYKINNKPIFCYSLEKFLSFEDCQKVVVVCQKDELTYIKDYLSQKEQDKIEFIDGGSTRQESVLNGLKKSKSEYVLVHDGARPCVTKEEIEKLLINMENCDSATLASPIKECVREINGNLNKVLVRENLFSMKTPQGLRKEYLIKGLERAKVENKSFYDDVSVLEEYYNIFPEIVIGKDTNIKVTTVEDLEIVKSLLGEKMDYRIGHSNDTHQLVNGRKMIIGGVTIPFELGCLAHSDGDVLFHAISEAIIGALGKGDLGKHFSDKDEKYKGISSSYFLEESAKMLEECSYEIQNIDATIFIEKPMMAPYISEMKENVAKYLKTDVDRINIKATRGEKVGPVGKMEAVVSEAVVMIKKK